MCNVLLIELCGMNFVPKSTIICIPKEAFLSKKIVLFDHLKKIYIYIFKVYLDWRTYFVTIFHKMHTLQACMQFFKALTPPPTWNRITIIIEYYMWRRTISGNFFQLCCYMHVTHVYRWSCNIYCNSSTPCCTKNCLCLSSWMSSLGAENIYIMFP